MHADALVFALLAVGDFALIVYLRRLHGLRQRRSRMRESLRYAIRRATDPTFS
jgi:hypothetical protein